MIGKQSLATGLWRALIGAEDWRRHFNLRKDGIYIVALLLAATALCYFSAYRVALSRSDMASPGGAAIAFILIALYACAFPFIAAAIAFFQGRPEGLRSWIIVRSYWALILAVPMALLFGAHLIGLPFALAYWPSLICYIGLLLIDVRLAQTIMDQSWIMSMFTGIIIWVGSTVLALGGLALVSGA